MKAAVPLLNEPTDPDTTNRTADQSYVQRVTDFLRRYIPQAVGKVNETRVCLYTMTPDEHFIIDKHPAYPHVVFGAGFSGHGFKFGVLIGRILADLAMKGTTPYDISLFSVKRLLEAPSAKDTSSS